MTPRIAVLDDEHRMAEILSMVMRREGYSVDTFTSPALFLEQFEDEPYDLVLTDLKMPKTNGVEVLKRVKEISRECPVILVTAHATVKTAIEAMRQGAFDYIEKPFENDATKALVKRALAMTALERDNRYLRRELASRYSFDNMVTVSEPMQSVMDLSRRAAKGRATVLIHGATGTGKELIARAIHYYSDRVGKPFIAVNCKAFASGVLESELFGHEKGAFTGASASRAGVFERADGGTLFLDEIGDIDSGFQAKLLRVLQEREVQRVGDQRTRKVDVRVVAATNRDLSDAVEKGDFREDLYFRLAVIPIVLPPLSERRADVVPLARFFLARFNQEMGREITGWEKAVDEYFESHDWPGNVRELENALERAVVLARGQVITLSDLRPAGIRSPGATADPNETLNEHLDRAAAEKIRSVLHDAGGVRLDAAKRLGIERTTLYRLMKKYGIDV